MFASLNSENRENIHDVTSSSHIKYTDVDSYQNNNANQDEGMDISPPVQSTGLLAKSCWSNYSMFNELVFSGFSWF